MLLACLNYFKGFPHLNTLPCIFWHILVYPLLTFLDASPSAFPLSLCPLTLLLLFGVAVIFYEDALNAYMLCFPLGVFMPEMFLKLCLLKLPFPA